MTSRTRTKANRTGGTTRRQAKPRLRLVKVLVQPVFMLDDGTTLKEVTASPLEIMATDWEGWAASAFDAKYLAEARDVLLAPAPAEDG